MFTKALILFTKHFKCKVQINPICPCGSLSWVIQQCWIIWQEFGWRAPRPPNSSASTIPTPHCQLPEQTGLSLESHGSKPQTPDPKWIQPQRSSPILQILSLPFHFLHPQCSLLNWVVLPQTKAWERAPGAIHFILHLGLSNWANINIECAAKLVCQINNK